MLNLLQPAIAFTKLECICTRVSNNGNSYIVAAIYRPGSEAVCSKFRKEFVLLLEYLSSFQTLILIAGDINIHIERSDDTDTIWFINALSSFGLVQHVNADLPTHNKGGTLDVIITRSDDSIRPVEIQETGLSDHVLLLTDINLQKPINHYVTTQSRSWRQIDIDKFKADLLQVLSTELTREQRSIDDMINTFNNTVTSALDRHAPIKTVTRRLRPSDAWYYEQCREQKRISRKLERRYKRTHRDVDHATWLSQLHSMHKLNDSKRSQFWSTHISSQRGKPREMWNSINRLLGRQSHSQIDETVIDADTMASFFKAKVDDIRAATAHAGEPTYSCLLYTSPSPRDGLLSRMPSSA